MKKITAILVIPLVLLVGCTNTSQTKPSDVSNKKMVKQNSVPSKNTKKDSNQTKNDMESKAKSTWKKLSDNPHLVIDLGEKDKLLTRYLDDLDYDKIDEMLIDNDKKPVSKEFLKEIENDDAANTVDNILPDGRYLK